MYQLKVTVTAKDGKKPLLDRIVDLEECPTFIPSTIRDVTLKVDNTPSMYLDDVRFGSIIESMNILFSKVPHVVTFSFEKL